MKLSRGFCTAMLAASLTLTIPFAVAQQAGGTGGAGAGAGGTGGTGGAGAGAGAGATTTPGGTGRPPTTTLPQERPRFEEQPRPIYLSGKLMMADGSAVPHGVVIERVCNGTPRPEGYADSKGRFSITLGQNEGMFADASVSSQDGFGDRNNQSLGGGRSSNPGGFGRSQGITERDLLGCELRASLPGHRSSVVQLASRRTLDNPDVGQIILTRLGNVEGTLVSAVSAQAPKDAKKAFEKAANLANKKKFDEADKEFEKAVTIYPRFAEAWFQYGRFRNAQGKPDLAVEAFGKALEADPKFVHPYRELTKLWFGQQKWKETAEAADRCLKLDPFSYPDIHFYNSVANLYMKNIDQAEKSAREAIKLDIDNKMVMAHNLLGAILIEKQDYPGAAEELKLFVKSAKEGQQVDRAKQQIEQIEKALAQKNN